MIASELSGPTDLSKIDRPLANVMSAATSSTILFMVIYKERKILSLDFRLARNYVYAGYTPLKSFYAGDNAYEVDYPGGWNMEKAFSYLRGEID
jgi:hypothetical protein